MSQINRKLGGACILWFYLNQRFNHKQKRLDDKTQFIIVNRGDDLVLNP